MVRTMVTFVVVAVLAGVVAYKVRSLPGIGAFFLPEPSVAEMPFDWPAKVDAPYPDLALLDADGNARRLSEFRGKVILVELIGIPCSACQAYAGGHVVGPLGNATVQANLDSIDKYARSYGHFNLDDARVVFVQLLLFNEAMQAPSQAEARAWAEHFAVARHRNRVVLVGTAALASKQTYEMIPGFQLIDRDFVLRRDSSGHQPRHDLYRDLLPTMGRMVTTGK
jgi:hypothetical protein